MITFEPDKTVLGFWFVGYHSNYLYVGAYMEDGKIKFLIDSESDQLKPGCTQEDYVKHLNGINDLPQEGEVPADPLKARAWYAQRAAGIHDALFPLAEVFMEYGYTAKKGGVAYKLGPLPSSEANELLLKLPWDRLMGTDKGARC